jgi:hypothetical protein
MTGGLMTTKEQHIVDQFKKLDPPAQQRVMRLLLGAIDVQEQFNIVTWQHKIHTIGNHIGRGTSVEDMLNDIRDNRE